MTGRMKHGLVGEIGTGQQHDVAKGEYGQTKHLHHEHTLDTLQ